MKRITLYPAPHVEIRLHLSEEMIEDYKDCGRQAKNSAFEETKDCDACSWNKVKFGDMCMCEPVELMKLIGIDSDALMENYNLKNATKYGNRDAEQQNHSYSTMMLYEVADMIDDAPTIEAAPVVHGYNESNMRISDEFCCSECGLICKEVDRYEYDEDEDDWHCYEFEFRYCPNCGAKMRTK